MKHSQYKGSWLVARGLSCQINSLFPNHNTNIHNGNIHHSNSINQEALCSAEGVCMDSGGAFLRIKSGSDSCVWH